MSTAVNEWPRSIQRANEIDTAYRTNYVAMAPAATIKALLLPFFGFAALVPALSLVTHSL